MMRNLPAQIRACAVASWASVGDLPFEVNDWPRTDSVTSIATSDADHPRRLLPWRTSHSVPLVTLVEGDTCRVSPEYVTVCARGGFAMSLNFGLQVTVETRRT